MYLVILLLICEKLVLSTALVVTVEFNRRKKRLNNHRHSDNSQLSLLASENSRIKEKLKIKIVETAIIGFKVPECSAAQLL